MPRRSLTDGIDIMEEMSANYNNIHESALNDSTQENHHINRIAGNFDDIVDNISDSQENDAVFEQQLKYCSCGSEDEEDGDEEFDLMGGNRLSPNRMKQLEEEQELLNGSLMALTSHFAQVQLRLKQIVDSNDDQREELLKELEQFANRGIPDIRQPQICLTDDNEYGNSPVTEDKLELQRIKQKELIEKLKEQLEDLENYAYETGDIASIPSSMLLERQTVIIEQLKGKLPLNLDELDKSTPEELRKQVDKAIRDLVNPVIMKEQLVGQLKTQITDLERFIQFLQGTNEEHDSCTCNCPLHGNGQQSIEPYNQLKAEEMKRRKSKRNQKNKETNETAIKMIRRALTLLQVFAFTQFGCGDINRQFERNILKKSSKGNHWGDLRARLELAIDRILDIHHEKHSNDSDYTSDSDDSPTNLLCNERMTAAVRKELSSSLRDLLQHGLSSNIAINEGMSPSIFNWGCFSTRSQLIPRPLHAWDVIVKYYELKNGITYNACPARRLSQSFNLEIVGGMAITPKQTLLSCIDDIIETHTKLKRSPDSHFKAFVCAALNEGKLVQWLKLIVKSRTIIDLCYEKWSYLVTTGFDDSLRSLEKLSTVRFHLPTDLAIRQLQNIHDAF